MQQEWKWRDGRQLTTASAYLSSVREWTQLLSTGGHLIWSIFFPELATALRKSYLIKNYPHGHGVQDMGAGTSWPLLQTLSAYKYPTQGEDVTKKAIVPRPSFQQSEQQQRLPSEVVF